MPVFHYKVRDKSGLLIRGQMTADTQDAVANALRSFNHTILEVAPMAGLELFFHDLFHNQRRRVTSAEVLLFTRQLASMIHSGLPIITCLSNISEQTPNLVFKRDLEQIRADIEKGGSLAGAMEKHPKYFPKFFVSMVGVGEMSGRLDDILSRLVFIGKQEADIRSKVKGAMIYPVILVLISTLILIVMLIYVLPKFIKIYDSLGADLPLPTQILLGASGFLTHFWWAVVAAGIFAWMWFKRYRSTPQGRFNVDHRLLKVPVLGDLILKYNLARFSRTFGSLIKSGITVLQGLAVTETTMNNQVLITVIKDLRGSILEGQSLSEPLKLSGVFPPMVTQMISSGEQTGKLDDMLLDVAEFYDTEVDYEVRNLTTLIEPIMLVFMGLMVLFIALSVLVPIFKLTRVVTR